MTTQPIDPREYVRSTEFRATMLDAQRTLFKPRTITTQQELTLLSQTATDGDECYFLADATNGVRWRFRYNAASTSALRWEFVGGPPLTDYVGTGGADETTASIWPTWADLATDGPKVTVPLKGDYKVEARVHCYNSGGNAQALSELHIDGTAWRSLFNANVSGMLNIFTAATLVRLPTASFIRSVACNAGTVLKLRYSVSPGGTGQYTDRQLMATPNRVG